MSLILAIEPDAQQASRLSSLVSKYVHAELVHAETTEAALETLARVGDRVPDLVLVPSLLSPKEDATLAGALRVIASAANVRMLTIPVLADPEVERQPHGGWLARWRSRAPITRPAGVCDPAIFAAQITAYLADGDPDAEADDKEDDRCDQHAPSVTPAVTDSHDEVIAAHPAGERSVATPADEALTPLEGAWTTRVADVVDLTQLESPICCEASDELDDGETHAPVGDRRLFEAAEAEITTTERGLPDHIVDAEFEPVETPRVVEGLTTPRARSAEPPAEPLIDERTVDALIAPLLRELETSRACAAHAHVQPPTPSRATSPDVDELEDPMFFADPPAAPRAPTVRSAADERPAWLELIDSLRQDVDRLKHQREEDPAGDRVRQRAPKVGRRRHRPVLDEWGLFNPDECGFGALLAKLEEVSARS